MPNTRVKISGDRSAEQLGEDSNNLHDSNK